MQKRDELFIARMVRIIDELENKKSMIRTRKLDNETAFRHIFFVAYTGISWKTLHSILVDTHYQTVYKRFRKWIDLGIFEAAWMKLLSEYRTSRLSKNALHFQNMYIDTTMIKNIGGRDCTGGNPTDRGRKGTKVSVCIDSEKMPMSRPLFVSANVSDIKTVEDTITNIPFNLTLDGRRSIKIAGDKAYRSKMTSKRVFEKHRMRIITQPKKNEKDASNISKNDRAMFKKRIYIEHFFGMIKGWIRIRLRGLGYPNPEIRSLYQNL